MKIMICRNRSWMCNCPTRWYTVVDEMSVDEIYLCIYRIYIVPLQGSYSEALPAQARAKRKVLRRLKRARKITWKRAQFERKAIPDSGTSHREGPILFNGRVRTRYQIVTTRGRAKRSPTRTGR